MEKAFKDAYVSLSQCLVIVVVVVVVVVVV